ncbi:hypothetical protein CQW23_33209 [Capsicum baccatum]|uniref:Protein TAR1 n=1 Tax=Capsicum baccatum TaxID=33114 RepID=A0A2G2V2F1_CAPBA|nr:hypothetical protein CQW23_33209 [Capsicum baccatum]
MASGATCVQRLDGSWDSAIHTKYRISVVFFINTRAEISVAESRFHLQKKHRSRRCTPQTGREGQAIDSSIPWHFLRWGSLVAHRARRGARARDGGETHVQSAGAPRPRGTPQLLNTFVGSFCCAGFDNDPSAGSPTETLLRLLLPLNNKVQWTSRDVAGSEPPTSPRSEHFTGSFNRFNGLLATSRAANRPRRRDPNISPDHSIGSTPGGALPSIPLSFSLATIAPPRPNSSASSSVANDATDSRHERTMKRRRRCYTGTDGSHGLVMHAAIRPRCSPTCPLSAYANYRQSP